VISRFCIRWVELVTDQWRASLGVRDSESCWFMEEIGTYMRCWESPGDLPLVIEMFVSFREWSLLIKVKHFLERVKKNFFFFFLKIFFHIFFQKKNRGGGGGGGGGAPPLKLEKI
jgi:hypothetical protein